MSKDRLHRMPVQHSTPRAKRVRVKPGITSLIRADKWKQLQQAVGATGVEVDVTEHPGDQYVVEAQGFQTSIKTRVVPDGSERVIINPGGKVKDLGPFWNLLNKKG